MNALRRLVRYVKAGPWQARHRRGRYRITRPADRGGVPPTPTTQPTAAALSGAGAGSPVGS